MEIRNAVHEPYLLNRRELGLINIGGAGSVTIDGEEVALEFKEAIN